MCDRLRCEKPNRPIIDSCRDCLIPADGPAPEMFKEYAERCANCKWYLMPLQKCGRDRSLTRKNLWCKKWEDINGE